MSKNNFKFIVITNQACIARGIVTIQELNNIHQFMKDELMSNGIEILDIYYCPHHWNDNCECRKPKPGLFFKASNDFSFRLDKTVYVGDDINDCKAAYNAGGFSIFVGNQTLIESLKSIEKPFLSVTSLNNAVDKIKSIYHNDFINVS